MDPNEQNQNQNDQPVVDQPTSPSEPASEPQVAEKCTTCGGDSSNGNCTGCYQPNANCTCAPKPAEGGDAPVAPAM
ncbi:hypothetical protein HYS92_02895 [Candidatus Daviesbacteria bacterium]|nr:hypothetical protein [Candidatus Daviesbacteria bacterium]